MASVAVRGIRKSFQEGKPVLDDVSFEVAEGEFLTLLGGSGCGKSTLLRIVAGIETADSGSVVIGGADATRLSPGDRDLAMVFQSYALYPHMNVRDNITAALRLRRVAASEIDRRVARTASMLGISDLLGRRPAALSGGQRQRVALARTLVREPKAFLLDEPLSNLDAVLREKTRGEMKLLFKRVKGTVIYVTHDQVEAMTMSDRVVVLDKGRIQQIGAPEEIYRRPANVFVAGFVGSPAMCLFPVEDGIKAGWLSPRPEWQGLKLLAGVRPEDVAASDSPGKGLRKVPVSLVEPTGASSLITFDSGVPVRALVSGAWDRSRSEAWAALRPERLHLFDVETGARWEAGLPPA